MKSWILFAAGIAALGVGIAATPRHNEAKARVELYLSTDCPIAMQYTPRISALVAEHNDVQFKAYFPNDLETRAEIAAYMKERNYGFSYDLDLGAVRAKQAGVSRVPTAVVYDARGKIVYVGALDDHKDSRLVKQSYVANTLAKLEKGETVKPTKTEPFGCLLMPGEAPPKSDKINYAEHVAPILNKHCVECHRPGEVAPFSLTGYENAKKWAPMIVDATSKRQMPPWKAVHGYGEFLDENRLSETQIAILSLWNAQKAPRGNAKKEPATPAFSGEWTLGQPDMVLSPNKPYEIDAVGSDDYRNFVLPLNNKETLWVTGMDVKPGNKKVVHHVIGFIDSSQQGKQRAEREDDGKEGYSSFGGVGFLPYGSLGGWAPGLRPRKSIDDIAFEVPPNSSIVMQVHYHKNGKPESDKTQLGLYLSKGTPKQALQLRWLANPLFRIPAGAKNHYVKLEYKVPVDTTVYGAMPHMHLLGRTMMATIILPDGTQKPLVYINDWDFNWQMAYVLKEPIKLPAGSKILVEATYDNSAENKNNPNNPPKPVTWGEETTDEMFLLVVPYTVDGKTVGK